MPDAVIIAGANGAGKTTFARHFVSMAFPDALSLNADEIQAESIKTASALAAGRELIRRLEKAVTEHQVFVVETTSSSKQYAKRIPAW